MKEITENLIKLNLQVVQLFQQGNLKQAMIVGQQALNLAQKNTEKEHPAIADSLNNIAELYRLQGRYLEAQPLYLQALAIRKNLFGDEHPDIAQALNNIAALYFLQGSYTEAEQKYLEALALWKRLLGDEHPDVATSLNNIAELYREQGRYLESEQIHLETLAMRKRLWGSQHPDIVQSLNNLAILYESQRRYSDAEKMHINALNMRKSLLGNENPDVAASFNNLAALYHSQGRYSEAERNYLETLTIWESLLDEHPDVATTLNNLAELYREQGHYLKAEQMHLDVLAMKKRLLGDKHPNITSSLNNIAQIYQEQGRYLEAEQNYLEALELRKHLFGSEHPDVATSLNDLAVVYTYQGRYQKAEKIYLQALAMIKRLRGNEHLDVANNLNNLAELYCQQGRYSEAEQKHLEALTIKKYLLGDEHPDVAISLSNIAKIYRFQGRYLEAEQKHMLALAMRKRLLGSDHRDVAASLNSLAVLYDAQFNYSQAEKLLLEALAIAKKQSVEHPLVASCMNNLAVIYSCQGRFLDAEQIHLSVLKIRKHILGEEHPEIALILNNLAEMYFAQGRYPEAEQKYVEVLEMRQRLLGEEHPDVARSLNNLATVLTATDRPTNSLSYRRQAIAIHDKMIDSIFAFSSESDRLSFLQKIRANFDLFLSLVHKHLSNSENAKQAAFDLVLKRKALTASALAAQNEALSSGRYPHLTEKFRQLGDLSAQLIHLTFSIPPTVDLTTYQENLAQLQAQHNNLQKQLASQVPEIQLFEQPSDRYAVASALPSNSILVEFVRFNVFNFHAVTANAEAQWQPAHYLAFILISGQPDAVQMIDLGEAQPIDYLIQQFCLLASDYTKKTLAWGKKTLLEPKLPIKPYNPTAAIELSKALFHPIRELVRSCKHLIFAPDGDLNLVPLQILPFDRTVTKLLMDEYTISYLSVGRDVLRSQAQPTRTANVPLVIADPDFDLASDQTSIIRDRKAEFVNTLGSVHLSRAPGTRFLGESVAQKLKNARLYLDSEAISTRLTTNPCPSIMLIATHGLFLPDSQQQSPALEHNLLSGERFSTVKVENPMMRSGLAFAGANTWLSGATLPTPVGKGFVFAQDIASLDLWANELTVLSACDTARGDIKIGEGVFGLRRAFAVAGTKTLVMSLWKVPDKATALLMKHFFDNLQSGMGRADALQNAQAYIRKITVNQLRQSALGIEVLKELLGVRELSASSKIDCQEKDTPLEHPFYWGAWICQGDTNSVITAILK